MNENRQVVVIPERIELGDVCDIERHTLHAQKVRQQLEPIHHRIDVPVDMIGGSVRDPIAGARRLG